MFGYLLVGVSGAWLAGRSDVAALPFVVNVLPYAPPAMLLLVGYLGGQLNQSRLLYASVVLLSAYGVLLHPEFVVPEGLAILAMSLPLSLALVFLIPEGRMFEQRGVLRLALVVLPVAAFTALLVQQPDWFASLVAWRPSGLPEIAGLPTAALLATAPLAIMTFRFRRDRVASILPAVLATIPPVYSLFGPSYGPAAPRAALVFTVVAAGLLHAALRMYWRRAYLDELTELPNRRALEDELARLLPPYAVAMIDLDHFKRVNDRYGHDQGDQVLRYAAAHLARELGPRVYRYGGEEFCVLFQDFGRDAARDAIERARRGFGQAPFKRRSGRWWNWLVRRLSFAAASRPRTMRVTLSAGLAASRRSADTPEKVRAAADSALYRAKAAGRNRLVVSG